MTTTQALDDLRARILSRYSILLLHTYEELRWEQEIADLVLEMGMGLVVWSATGGAQPALSSNGSKPPEPLEFLDEILRYPDDHVFLLKDLHPFLNDPLVVRKLRDSLPSLVEQRKTLIMIGPVDAIPLELAKDTTTLEAPLPDMSEMRGALQSLLETEFPHLELDEKQSDHMVKAVLGLTLGEARKAFARALQGRDVVTDEVYMSLVSEKRHMVQGSQLLEFFDLEEGMGDIGGLDGLKEWLDQRSEAFSADAQEKGISNPKGVLLAGVQGCGKSLSAKAIARLLGFPLVRMDLSALLESQRGGSEQNLREVLRLMETIAPSVLWLEEIDKAFAGFAEEAKNDATMARIVGRFLTWLQEHKEPVFVVATANNVSRLPPELLRRGRFDELFFVDLPNYYERMAIFKIHFEKRGWKADLFDIDKLATDTEGYSGAEIETIVNSAIIEAYSQGRIVSMNDLNESRERTVPLSKTMEDEIFRLREWARTRCRPATIDSRIIQVMEGEIRRGEQNVADGSGGPPELKWKDLAQHGQIRAAIVEHIRCYDHVTLARLLADFEKYTETAGEFGLVLKADTKVVVWTRMSKDFADMISEYIAGRRLFLHPATADAFEGAKKPQLSVLEKLDDEKVAKPSWLPTTLRLQPPQGGSGKLARVARIKLGK